MENRALGKGLSALIQKKVEVPIVPLENNVQSLPTPSFCPALIGVPT